MERHPTGSADFFPVSPLLLFPDTQGEFEIYVEMDGLYLLYTRQKERFDEAKRQKLHDDGVEAVYILREQKAGYDAYVRRNLGDLLENEEIPLTERAGTLYKASVGVVEDFFETGLPENLRRRCYTDIVRLVRDSLSFLGSKDAFKKLARLVSHNYHLYTHSVNVFILTAAVLKTYEPNRGLLLAAGVGAVLHDLGKADWPEKRFVREDPRITETDRRCTDPHPAVGAAQCAALPLPRLTLGCILLHHEHEDGTGYPAGISGTDIPVPIKVLSLCNMYDRLTSEGPGGEGVKPFEALKFIRSDMKGAFDPDAYRRLVLVLGGADIL